MACQLGKRRAVDDIHLPAYLYSRLRYSRRYLGRSDTGVLPERVRAGSHYTGDHSCRVLEQLIQKECTCLKRESFVLQFITGRWMV